MGNGALELELWNDEGRSQNLVSNCLMPVSLMDSSLLTHSRKPRVVSEEAQTCRAVRPCGAHNLLGGQS